MTLRNPTSYPAGYNEDEMVQVARHLFTVDEYHRMGEVGIFHEDDRVELIEGEIIEMTPIGSHHAGAVKELTRLFYRKLDDTQVVVSVQDPVVLSRHSEPQPDLCLLRPRADSYRDSNPATDDILLLVEVADSSLTIDRQVKLPVYATTGVPEVWIVDVAGERIYVHRSPQGDTYTDQRTAVRGESVSPAAFPDISLAVNDILG